MIQASVAGDRIALTCPATWTEVAKRIPGGKYRDGAWSFPLTWPACKQLRAEFGESLVVGQDLAEWARNNLDRRATMLKAKAGEFVAPDLDDRLRPQQALGATWMAWAGRCMLLDEMRGGKTPQTIQALRTVGDAAYPALIVAPSTNRWVWADEFQTWNREVEVQVLSGTAAQRHKQLEDVTGLIADGLNVVVITNWESLRTLSRLESYGSVELSEKERERGPLNAIGFKTVVADEAHRALDPHAKQTRALWFLMHEAQRRYVLTATGIVNNGGDLYSLWHAVAPEETPVRTAWIQRYCQAGMGAYGWEIGGFRPETSEEMFECLEPRMLRRTLDELRPGMPPVLPTEIRRVELEGKQATTYRSLKKDMLAMLKTETGTDGVLVVTDPLVLAGRLAYAAAATPVLDDAGGVVALALPSIKIDVLREVLAEYPGEALVVFMASRKLAVLCEEILTKDKVAFVSIHGGIDAQLRAANIAMFQSGAAQVCICTYAAGAEGITLNRAHRTLALQRSWSQAQNVQADARTRGLEGGPPVELIISCVAGSIEERVLKVGDLKSGYLQELLRDELRQP